MIMCARTLMCSGEASSICTVRKQVCALGCKQTGEFLTNRSPLRVERSPGFAKESGIWQHFWNLEKSGTKSKILKMLFTWESNGIFGI
ncbi:hypothetical protein GDO86_020617 [Hymenochirus boettgeri]|uniref:Uncharacterized protein n=1 Tax=Hymenochirus boettgeri TaxID=247094 RepID=A0A8T2IJU8_9PIPI|nr:hypothetical protein GDO86_020617 [Hymenochirus boettgeri]